MRLPLRTKLTLLSAGVMAIVLAATGILLYANFRSDLFSTLDDNLATRGATLREVLEREVQVSPNDPLLLGTKDSYFQIILADGRVFNSWDKMVDRPLLNTREFATLSTPERFTGTIPTTDGGLEARMLAVPTSDGRAIVVGSALDDTQSSLQRLALLLVIGGLVTLGLATFAAWRLTGAALRPVDRMREQADAITAGRPGNRLPVPDTGDEIARLGETLNAMLARLEEAFEREHRFVDDASHELRTPLGILRTELELALRHSRTKEELEAALRSAAEESDRLNRLAEDLLVLARADRGLLPVEREPVDLAVLTSEIAATFRAKADGAGVSLERHIGHLDGVPLDPMRIRQALSNLMDNALRHTPRGGVVRIIAEPRQGTVTLAVSDTGDGFPPDFLPHAFDPFWRPDASRARDEGGAGLGLSIVRAVAEAHGGRASAHNNPGGGATVTLELPVVAGV